MGPFTIDFDRGAGDAGAREIGGAGALVEITSLDYTSEAFRKSKMRVLAMEIT